MATWAFRHRSSFGVPCNYSHIGDGDSADSFILALNGGCGRPTFRSVKRGAKSYLIYTGDLESSPNWWNPSHNMSAQ